jgi:uncharacterized protein YhhL (DUF1145 family)
MQLRLLLMLPRILLLLLWIAQLLLGLQTTCGTAGTDVRAHKRQIFIFTGFKKLTELMANSSSGSMP